MPTDVSIRPIQDKDREWLKTQFISEWGSDNIYSRGKIHTSSDSKGFIAEKSGIPVGFIAYVQEDREMEALAIAVIKTQRRKGIGKILFTQLINYAKGLGNIKRLWGITTNDNIETIGFVQKLGFRLVAIHPSSVTQARQSLKPEIPLIGVHGIPLRDEIEFEYPSL